MRQARGGSFKKSYMSQGLKSFLFTKFPPAVCTGMFLTFCVATAVFLYAAWVDQINEFVKAEGYEARKDQYEAQAKLARQNNAEKKMAASASDCQARVVFVSKEAEEKPADAVESYSPGEQEALAAAQQQISDLAKQIDDLKMLMSAQGSGTKIEAVSIQTAIAKQ